MDIAELNFYVFIAEVLLAILFEILGKIGVIKEPLKLRYCLLLWTIVAFAFYAYDSQEELKSIVEVIELFLISIPAGFILGYPASLAVYVVRDIGGSIVKAIYEIITGK